MVALCLKRHDFKLLLGPLTDIMAKRIKGYTTTEYEEGADGGKTEDEQNVLIDIAFTDLSVVGTLGKGSFGHVQLVKHKDTGVTYALKAVNKQQIVDTHQQEHIMSEKRVMMRMNHPFLIRLYQTFKDRNSLYFVLEAVMGGELFRWAWIRCILNILVNWMDGPCVRRAMNLCKMHVRYMYDIIVCCVGAVCSRSPPRASTPAVSFQLSSTCTRKRQHTGISSPRTCC